MSEVEIARPEPTAAAPVTLVAVPSPVDRFKRLRETFEPHQIGKLPRGNCSDCKNSPKKVCDQHTKRECRACGNYMTTAHKDLDYIGHAAVTDRLLEVDPEWTWEPVALDPQTGCPLIINNGSTLWIKLTILGVTRIGVGTVERGTFEAEKQLIGDAIRNAAMRFGVALDLWSKEDLSRPEESSHEVQPPAAQAQEDTQSEPQWASEELTNGIRDLIGELSQESRTELSQWWKESLPSGATVNRLTVSQGKKVSAKVASLTASEVKTAPAVLPQSEGESPTPTAHQLLDVVWVEREVHESSDQKNVTGLILNRVVKDIAKDVSDDEARMVADTVDGMTDDDLKALILEAQ